MERRRRGFAWFSSIPELRVSGYPGSWLATEPQLRPSVLPHLHGSTSPHSHSPVWGCGDAVLWIWTAGGRQGGASAPPGRQGAPGREARPHAGAKGVRRSPEARPSALEVARAGQEAKRPHCLPRRSPKARPRVRRRRAGEGGGRPHVLACARSLRLEAQTARGRTTLPGV